MSHNNARDLFSHDLPFENTSNYDIENEFRSAKFLVTQFNNDHRLVKFWEYFLSSFLSIIKTTLATTMTKIHMEI